LKLFLKPLSPLKAFSAKAAPEAAYALPLFGELAFAELPEEAPIFRLGIVLEDVVIGDEGLDGLVVVLGRVGDCGCEEVSRVPIALACRSLPLASILLTTAFSLSLNDSIPRRSGCPGVYRR
jgi:hypothetical protein